jgi:hypothetical protein
MNKIKPPTFDDEQKKDEDAETWLLGMRICFQLHNYSSHAEGRIFIYTIIHVVGSACAGAAHQREKCYLEKIQEVF